MAAKRLFDDASRNDSDPAAEEKRMRTTPSFANVIKEAVMMKSFQSFCTNLEPLLRRVVQEEVERGVTRVAFSFLSRSPSTKIPALGESSLQLIFSKKLSLPLFTGSKIEDEENNPLQILLVDTSGGRAAHMTTHSLPIKVELVVLDGDFPAGDSEDWTQEEFEKNIIRERQGRRPLLAGEVSVTVRDGVGVVGEIEFTDNSSWIRSRNFRIGARVVQETSQGRRIKEAKTEAFSVRDHRGELYRKHYPPALEDDVWRLERIGKDGAFHKKLTAAGIQKVQDFLKLFAIDPNQLRRILGGGMSDKMWDGTMKHALTCDMGNKLYLHRNQQATVVLNPICQVVGVVNNGQRCPVSDLSPMHKAYLQHLAGDAYKKWSTLEEIDALQSDSALLQYDATAAMGSHHDIIPSNVHHMQGFLEVAEDGFSVFDEWMQPNYMNGNIEIVRFLPCKSAAFGVCSREAIERKNVFLWGNDQAHGGIQVIELSTPNISTACLSTEKCIARLLFPIVGFSLCGSCPSMHKPARTPGTFADRPFLLRTSPIQRNCPGDVGLQQRKVSSVAGGVESSGRTGKRKQRSNDPCLFQTVDEGGESGRLVLSAAVENQNNPTSATDVGTHPLVLSAAVGFQKLLATGTIGVQIIPTIGALDVFDQMSKRNLASVNVCIMKMMSISTLIHVYVEADHEVTHGLVSGIMKMMSISTLIHVYQIQNCWAFLNYFAALRQSLQHPVDHLLQNPAIKEAILKPPSDCMEHADVIIVGADLAGLRGPVLTRKMQGDGVVAVPDLGASILTGINVNPICVLARQLGYPLHKVRDKCPLYLPGEKAVDPDIDSRVEFTFNGLLDKVCKLHQTMLDEVKYGNVSLGTALESFRHVYRVAESVDERTC
ncbi:hypothetical protein ACLOJK_033047 [Asimina triloba]